MKKLNLAVVVALLLQAPAVFSAEVSETQPVIVTATRTAASEASIGKTVNVITQKDIQITKDSNLPEALIQIPGIRSQRLGGPGAFTNISIRGLRSFDTQILINGLPLRDAADPQGSANGLVQDLKTDFISQIDVVQGSSSTLYGSDSVGGTINFISQAKAGDPSLNVEFEGGTLSTYKQTYSVSGGESNLNYSLGYTRTTSEGIDSHDDYENNFYSALFNFSGIKNLEVGFNFLASDSRLDLNEEATFVGGKLITASDDPNDYKKTDFFHYGTFLTFQATDSWEHIVRFGAVDTNKEFIFKTDPNGSDFASDSEYNGNTYNLEYQTNYQFDDRNLITFGYEHEREEMKQITEDLGSKVKEKFDQYKNSFYLQDQINLLDETLFITGGIRVSDHETAGTDVNGEGSIAYHIKDSGTKIRGHIGTGFRAPSLFELFGASTFGGFRTVYGNKSLDPEESISWDIGIDQKLCTDESQLSVTFFRQDFDKIIEFKDGTYQNVTGADSYGIETELKCQITSSLLGTAFYTYTHSEASDGTKMLGIPKHIWGCSLLYRFLEKFQVMVRGTYKGKDDFNVFTLPSFTTVRLEANDYFKVDAVISYQINKNAEIYFKAENIFDEKIVENGFEGIPAIVFGGVKIKI